MALQTILASNIDTNFLTLFTARFLTVKCLLSISSNGSGMCDRRGKKMGSPEISFSYATLVVR